MLKKSFENHLREIIKKDLNVKVKSNSKIYDYEEWDSVGNFNILLSCEKYFKLEFTPKEFNSLNSFKEILKIVKKRNRSRKKN
jgi:acyl carrier protein|tara:strand:+ start:253 stop:501 length:249 start_codon:yes stop_codon:yes gene_type:complete